MIVLFISENELVRHFEFLQDVEAKNVISLLFASNKLLT